MSSFTFHYSPPNLDLHSFPTRRSSDLSLKRIAIWDDSSAAGQAKQSTAGDEERSGGFNASASLYVARLAVRRSNYRSEEHTSELQSHHDLVCRLLLEKKKTNNNI